MKRVDWQEFDDQQGSAMNQQAADDLLNNSGTARNELEGLQAFKAAIKSRSLSEDVPAARLEAMLKEISTSQSTPKPTFGVKRLLIAGIAAAAVTVVFVNSKIDHHALNTTPEIDIAAMVSVASAEEWIESQTSMDLPKIELPKGTEMVLARVGKEGQWACIDFEHNGKTYYLYVSPNRGRLDGAAKRDFNGVTYYQSQGVGWKSPTLAYYLKGGEDSIRWQFATTLAPQTL